VVLVLTPGIRAPEYSLSKSESSGLPPYSRVYRQGLTADHLRTARVRILKVGTVCLKGYCSCLTLPARSCRRRNALALRNTLPLKNGVPLQPTITRARGGVCPPDLRDCVRASHPPGTVIPVLGITNISVVTQSRGLCAVPLAPMSYPVGRWTSKVRRKITAVPSHVSRFALGRPAFYLAFHGPLTSDRRRSRSEGSEPDGCQW